MKNKKFEQAKQAVAEKHGEISWAALLWHQSKGSPRILDEFYRELFEHGCNDAVLNDRAMIMDMEDELIDTYEGKPYISSLRMQQLPLPFPQQPDGR